MKAVKQLRTTNSSVTRTYAQSESGQWFTRYQDKGPYGYFWTKWQATQDPGDYNVRPANFYEAGKVRLPG